MLKQKKKICKSCQKESYIFSIGNGQQGISYNSDWALRSLPILKTNALNNHKMKLNTRNFKTTTDFTQYRYTPNKKFSGHTECLTINPLEYYYRL